MAENSSHTPTPWSRNIPPITKYPTIFSGRNQHVLVVLPQRTGMWRKPSPMWTTCCAR